ncbi:MAG: DNA/RNA non-specific endonuclease [Saprospiraceae bacterium]|nr:DNA/RNA non-specific endonuclease [Saprospiraceae bacterium]
MRTNNIALRFNIRFVPNYHSFWVVLLAITLSSCSFFEEEVIPILEDNSNTSLALGNPSNARASFLEPNNFLIERTEYALSYNNERGIPNWVSWHLDRSWIGSTDRAETFKTDPFLNNDFNVVSSSDYTNSGFDRGHNCPSADRTRSTQSNEATFFMTNIVPQAPRHNQGPWKDMEEFGRDLVFEGNELYVVMGNFGVGGTGSKGYVEKIGRNSNVVVPKYIWKVYVVLPEDDNDLLRVDESTRVIAVIIENTNEGLKAWHEYRISVDEIEDATGLDLFSELPFFVQSALESKIDDGPVN